MSVAKVVEITSASNESFEAAIKSGIAKASETLHGIAGAWVNEQSVTVRDGQVAEYRVNMRVTFILE
jgi:flavin-binding protein dodecin